MFGTNNRLYISVRISLNKKYGGGCCYKNHPAAATPKKIHSSSPVSFHTQPMPHFAWTLKSSWRMASPNDSFFSPRHFVSNDPPHPSVVGNTAQEIIRNRSVAGRRKSPKMVSRHYPANIFFVTDVFGIYTSTANNTVKAHVPITLVSKVDFLLSSDLSLSPFLYILQTVMLVTCWIASFQIYLCRHHQ